MREQLEELRVMNLVFVDELGMNLVRFLDYMIQF